MTVEPANRGTSGAPSGASTMDAQKAAGMLGRFATEHHESPKTADAHARFATSVLKVFLALLERGGVPGRVIVQTALRLFVPTAEGEMTADEFVALAQAEAVFSLRSGPSPLGPLHLLVRAIGALASQEGVPEDELADLLAAECGLSAQTQPVGQRSGGAR